MPNHHGAWAILIMLYVVGLIWAIGAGRFSWPLALLAPVQVVGYFTLFATVTWLRSNFKPRYRHTVLTYNVITVVLSILLLALRPVWWAWVLVFGPPTGIGLWLARKRRKRSLLPGFVAVLAVAGLSLVLGSEKPLSLSGLSVLAGLSLTYFGYFFGTVFYVKTNVWERGRASYIVYSVTWYAACVVPFAVVDLHLSRRWLVAFPVACTLQAWLVSLLGVMKSRKVTTKQFGYMEIVTTAALLAIPVPGVLIA